MEKIKQIIIMNEGVTYNVTDREDCVQAIIEEYHRFDVSMYELLASIEINGFSAEDVVDIYAECMKISDGDAIIHFKDEVPVMLVLENEVRGLK